MSTAGTLDTEPGASGPSRSADDLPTLVFVHGAWHGAWCWDGWSAAARSAGYPTATLSLPAHDRPGSPRRIWPRMGSYLRHVRTVVESIDGPVVVVGHSMGGYITQRLLERPPANVSGAALVASVPRRGVAGAVLRLLRRSPGPALRALSTCDLYQLCRTEALTRSAFFSAATPDDVVASGHARLQNESYLAFPPMLLRWTRPAPHDVPVMVLAAEEDALFSIRSQRRLARTHGTTVQLVPGGHDVMLDITADGAVHLVLDWVRRTTV